MTVHKKKLRIPQERTVFLYRSAVNYANLGMCFILLPVLPTYYVCLVLKSFTAILVQYQQRSNVTIFLTKGKITAIG